VWDGEMRFKAFVDSRDNEIKNIDNIVRIASGRCSVVAIVKCDKVTFNGGKYGLKWWVQQLKVYSTTNSMNKYDYTISALQFLAQKSNGMDMHPCEVQP
jgi:hypothetical protein